ncbi:hypothetical protein [Vibrio fluvialis]|uniref:hypothetical protein n=1 Tax=Vibrio fluvialis TaxID=676 RepID=UPI001269239F|nr:hypothetical protein [Vibrio fluvialis]
MSLYQVADLKIVERLLEHPVQDMAISKPRRRPCSVSDATKKPTFERRLWVIHNSSYEYALGHRISELRLARK